MSLAIGGEVLDRFSKLFGLTLTPSGFLKFLKKLRNKSKYYFLVLPEYSFADEIIGEINAKHGDVIYPFKFDRLANFLGDEDEKKEYVELSEMVRDGNAELLVKSLYERLIGKLIGKLFEALGSHLKGRKILFVGTQTQVEVLDIKLKKIIYGMISDDVFDGEIRKEIADKDEIAKVIGERSNLRKKNEKGSKAFFCEFKDIDVIIGEILTFLKIKEKK